MTPEHQQACPLGPEDLRQLHGIQLEILQEFDRICTQLGLRYQIAAGTLLGAIRHGGFIPWDDDIDVIMLRADYERLLRRAPPLLGERYFLQCWKSDPGFQCLFAKLRRNGSCFRECNEQDDMHHGIFIDIFPFDAVAPECRSWRLRFLVICFALRWISRLQRLAIQPPQARLPATRPEAWRRSLERLAHRLLAPIPGQFWPWLPDALLRLIRSHCSDRVVCLASGWQTLERTRALTRPVAEFEETVWMCFEGLLLPATASYDQALTRLYGDYQRLPEPERRVGNHPVLAFSLPEDL